MVWNYALQDVTQDRSSDVKYSIKNEIFNQFVVFSVFDYVKSSYFSFKCTRLVLNGRMPLVRILVTTNDQTPAVDGADHFIHHF